MNDDSGKKGGLSLPIAYKTSFDGNLPASPAWIWTIVNSDTSRIPDRILSSRQRHAVSCQEHP